MTLQVGLFQRGGLLLLVAALSAFAPRAARADETQLWTVVRADGPLTKRMAGQLLARFRFDDDVSRAEDFMLRGLSHWELGPFDAGVGYDYIYSFVDSETREHRPFQIAEHRVHVPILGGFSIKNRLRFDQRFRSDVDGVIFRLRYRLRLERRLGAGWYAAVSDEIFGNLNDRGAGPPSGFEQNRLRFGLGRTLVPGIRLEANYEWQLSAGRSRPNENRHVLLLQLFAAPRTFREARGD